LLAIVAGGCGGNSPPADLAPPDVLTWAREQFELEDYNAAAAGYRSFLFRDPLNPLSDSAQYMIAESELRAGHELEAADEFQRLATGRPNSPWADDAQYGVCRAYYEASPRVTLSQEFMERAIVECQRVLQFFPASELRPAAEAQLQSARHRLAEKSFTIGRYYYRRKFFESANVYFEKALAEQPAPELMPELLELLYLGYRRVGFDTEAATVRTRLLDGYPDSEEAARVASDGGHAG